MKTRIFCNNIYSCQLVWYLDSGKTTNLSVCEGNNEIQISFVEFRFDYSSPDYRHGSADYSSPVSFVLTTVSPTTVVSFVLTTVSNCSSPDYNSTGEFRSDYNSSD